MSDDLVKALETMDWDDIRDRPSAAGVLMEEAAAEITRLRAAINDALTAPWPVPELNSTWHQEPIGPNETPEEAIKRLVNVRAEWAVYKNNCENPVIAELRAALATARREVEQERDEFFNRLGRITEYLDIPVDATAQRIIDAIQERVDNEREACASVEVRLTVPEGAEAWTPLDAWEEALIAFDEAFRDAIRAAAKEGKP